MHGMHGLVLHEVQALMKAHAQITVTDCTNKCDAIFGLLDPMDEDKFDKMCEHICECEINKSCTHDHPTGQPMHPTGQPMHPTGQPMHPTGQPMPPTGQPMHP